MLEMKDNPVDPAAIFGISLRGLWSLWEEIDDEIINVTMGLLSAEDASKDSQTKWLYMSSHFMGKLCEG